MPPVSFLTHHINPCLSPYTVYPFHTGQMNPLTPTNIWPLFMVGKNIIGIDSASNECSIDVQSFASFPA